MYSWRKGIASWQVGKMLYISVPFTWLLADAQKMAANWKGKVLIGGPALMKPNECEGFEPVLFHNPCATFTTRGCPNRCLFCAVWRLEPEFKEIPDYRPAPVICDNNFTAASRKHQERVIERQKVFHLTDFNQGLQASKFTPELADLLGNIRCKVRFAFDFWWQEDAVKDAIDLCRRRTTKDIGVYVLIGFNDDPESALARLQLVQSWGIDPNCLRYQPLDATEKNAYVAPNWTATELANMTRYFTRTSYLRQIPYEEYKHAPKEQLALIGDYE